MSKKIPFSPPDISQLEIEGVIDTLKSGWITSGPKTAKFEEEIAKYSDANKGVAVSSATMGMELRSEEHTSELQSRQYLVCRLLLEKKKNIFTLNMLTFQYYHIL